MSSDQDGAGGFEAGGFEAGGFEAAQPPGFADLLTDAIDVHVHGQPDLALRFANRGNDLAVIRLAQRYGITGWVLKSHLWPTTDRARLLQQLTGPDFTVHGSITLNPTVGGPSATAVELAAAHGAQVIFLPTWGSAEDAERGGYIATLLRQVSPSIDRYTAERAIRITDDNNRLTTTATETLQACADLGLSLATGHLGLAESTALAEHAADIGYRRLLITHPLHYVDDPAELRRFTDTGALIEFAVGPLMHPDAHLHIRDVAHAIDTLGPDQLILSSDAFSRWAPAQPECLRIAAEQLRYLGIASTDLRQMLADNPRRFLGLDPVPAPIPAPAPAPARDDS